MVFHMARPLRIELPGALYYLTARGNAQKPSFSFRDDQDRRAFLRVLEKALSDGPSHPEGAQKIAGSAHFNSVIHMFLP